MSFDANLTDPKKEKHTLVVVRPRRRLTGWELYQDNDPLATYRVQVPLGFVTRVWNEYANDDGLYKSGSLALVLLNVNSWYYDADTGYLYFTGFKVGSFGTFADPDDNDLPGLTIEFELNLSDQTFIGPRDPLDATSQKVNWIGCLEASPFAQSGSRQSVYGFFPVNSSSLRLQNADGWMNEFLYESTFNLAVCKGYILTNADLIEGMALGEVRQVFIGYTKAMRLERFAVSLDCVDTLAFFEKAIALRRINDVDLVTYQVDFRAFLDQTFWYIRRIFGRVEGHRPVNFNFDYTPGTTVNRKWCTHAADEAIGSVSGARVFQDDGTLVYSINTGGANSTTRTYLTTAPKCMIDDGVIIKRSGTDRYATVTAVGPNYIDHSVISGSAAGGDTVTRPFVAKVTIKNNSQEFLDLLPGRDYDLLVDDTETNRIRGFVLHDNVEASMTGAPFDPTSWDVFCTVYGRSELDQFQDASDVGEVSDHGGTVAAGAALIYRLLIDAGFSRDQISDEIFANFVNDSLDVGFAVPEEKESLELPTYAEIIRQILQSCLSKLYVAEDSSGIAIGICDNRPFETPQDYKVTELQHGQLTFEHDYTQIYSDVQVNYNRVEDRNESARAQSKLEEADSEVAKSVHFVSQIFQMDSLLYAQADAIKLARRMAYILGDRRGYWTFNFELSFVNKTNLGTAYRIYRQQMPGYPLVENTQRDRELSVIEVNKGPNGVTLTLEDQKGIQDNSGAW